jgi:type IV secretory pathway VirJ component
MGAGPGIAIAVEDLGVPVLGISSLNRFRTRRTLPQAAAIVDGAVRSAMQKYSADRILLVGHSFGADVVAATLPDLSPDVRKSLVGVVVIVPSVPVYLKADPTSLSYRGKPDVARVQAVGGVRIVCIRGKLETDSMCPQLTGPNVTHIILPGGHALHHDTERLRSTLEATTAGMLHRRVQ